VSSPSIFYFDLASPLAYIAAELLPTGMVDWQPVLARGLPDEAPLDRPKLERLACKHGLQPLRWPADFPFDSELAMRVATYAKSIGRAIPFAQAAFRQAFAGGRSLADVNSVLIAAAACEMHPTAVLKGAELRSVREQLTAATAEAARLGATDVPAVSIDGQVLVGAGAIAPVAWT
jgi:2-hydroxychromene-2-carboxylate isomerase